MQDWVTFSLFEFENQKRNFSIQEEINLKYQKHFLTLRRPNFIGAHVPVAPDLAKTVKMGSDHSKNLTSVFYGAKNEKLSVKTIYIYEKFYKIFSFSFLLRNLLFIERDVTKR